MPTAPDGPSGPETSGWGPLPALPEAPPQPLSGARRTVLETLQTYAAPVTLAELGEATALHVNTLREHLEGLEAEGRVRRRRAAPSGRGRPAWLYEAMAEAPHRRAMEHAGLATALAAAIHRTSADPRADAVEAGVGWGRELVSGDVPPGGAESDREGRRRVVGLLDELGFAPEPDATDTEVRLTRCPLLDAARRYPDVVCGVHLGIVRGALETWDRPTDGVELLAFSEPGACRLRLPSSPGAAPPAVGSAS